MNKSFKFIAHPRKQAMHVESRPSFDVMIFVCPVGEEKGKGQKIFFCGGDEKRQESIWKGQIFFCGEKKNGDGRG